MKIQGDKLRPVLRVEFTFIACVISALLFVPQVWGQTPDQKPAPTPRPTPQKIETTVEIGAQSRELQGSHTAKFQETREVPAGFFANKLSLDFNSAESPFMFSARGLEILQLDQRYTADFWRVGKYRTQFVYDQVPHFFGTGKSFLQETAPGVYQVSFTLRARFQALTQPDTPTCTPVPDCQRTAPNAPLPTLVRQELLTAPTTEVRTRRDQALFRQSYQPSEKVELHFQFSRLRNRGTRPMSAGTFIRRNVQGPPPTSLGDLGGFWEGVGQEFLEPIDQRTTDINVGAHFSGKRWRASVDYDLSLFRNRIESLIFENPFRITDEQGTGATNRFREIRWQNDLAPNNDSHTISFQGSLDLPRNTQVRGLFSLAYWTQDDAFLPWTLNTAINPRNPWDPPSPITNPTDVNQLPAQSLNGRMQNINQEYALVNHNKNFRFQALYRAQSLDNQSAVLDFPGYAAFGDSTWRAPGTDFYNLRIENLDWDFRRQNVEAGFQWEVLPYLTWKMDYGGEYWNRKFRDVNRNNEHSIRARLDFETILSGAPKTTAAGKADTPAPDKPSAAPQDVEPKPITTIRVRADYRYANRTAQLYNVQPLTFCPANSVPPDTTCPLARGGAPAESPQSAWVVTSFTQMKQGLPIEFNLLRRFDENDRIRNDGSLTLELQRGPRMYFSASARYLGDEHDKNFYGRLFNKLYFFDAQFSYAFLNGNSVFVSYAREGNRFKYRDLAHLLPNPPAPPGAVVQGTLAQFAIANTWERTSRSSLDSFEVGINSAMNEGKLQLDLSYVLSFARDRINTVNPFTPRADSVLHAGANPYPDTVVRRQDVSIAITRRINERLEIGVRYWYEPYTQDDFSYNVLQPYVHGQLTSDTPKYLFQDARYASYHANVATVFLRYSFGSGQ